MGRRRIGSVSDPSRPAEKAAPEVVRNAAQNHVRLHRGNYNSQEPQGGLSDGVTDGFSGTTIDNDTGAVYVEQTADPDIVKQRKIPGQNRPDWAMAETPEYWYGPTDAALVRGKIIAAVDTISEIPERVLTAVNDAAKAVKDNLPSVAKWGIAALIAWAVIKASEGRR